LSFPIARLIVPVYFQMTAVTPWISKEACWLDTGAPLSIIPFHVHHRRLSWQPIAGIATTWAGQRCDLGRIDLWLATDQPPNVCGPLSLLAKFARGDPPGPPVPILLGLEFFLAHQAELVLSLPPRDGSIVFP
jgi:hypothetical protein